MGTCWTQCCVVFRREGSRILRAGGSSYFRSSTTGEHYTIEFENLVESDEEESPGRNHRVISEEEINHRRGHHYVAISDKQLVTEGKMKAEQMRVKAGGGSHGDGHKMLSSVGDCETYQQSPRASSEAFRSSRLYSETNVATPNTESSYDFTSKTRSTDDDGTSLDLEWEDEEGMTRMVLVRERSRTEEDILRAALRPSRAQMGSGPASASEESNALEWENDFVGVHTEIMGDYGCYGFINPLLDTPQWDPADDSGSDKQDR